MTGDTILNETAATTHVEVSCQWQSSVVDPSDRFLQRLQVLRSVAFFHSLLRAVQESVYVSEKVGPVCARPVCI